MVWYYIYDEGINIFTVYEAHIADDQIIVEHGVSFRDFQVDTAWT